METTLVAEAPTGHGPAGPGSFVGWVELDEVFVGNESRGAAGGMKDNTAVMVAVESLNDRRLGRVRLELAEVARSSNLVGFAMRVIEEGSTIKTDGATNLKRLAGLGYEHQRLSVWTAKNQPT
jgi:hypothetical protein